MVMDRPTTKEVARFLDKVRITKHCWLWIKPSLKRGYGGFNLNGRMIQAHRFSYELFVGPIDPGKQILHRRECGKPNCVNPHHLYMGTNDDNMRDLNTWGNPAIGERNGNSKLSENDILNIRKIHKNKRCGYKETAELFGVHPVHIGLIVRGLLWKHLLTSAK